MPPALPEAVRTCALLFLRGLNRLWDLSLSQQELCCIGAKLGADVPFCICGGYHARDRVLASSFEGFRHCRLGLSSCSHPPALRYRRNEPTPSLTAKKKTGTIDVDAVEAAIRQGQFEPVTTAMGNTFEELVMPDVPQVIRCRERLASLGLQPLMAGSGPTVFALVPPLQEEDVRRQVMTWNDVDTYMTTIVKREDGEY